MGKQTENESEPRAVARRSPQGFTLIELLVVIALNAILGALLRPALAKAKAKALPGYAVVEAHGPSGTARVYAGVGQPVWRTLRPADLPDGSTRTVE